MEDGASKRARMKSDGLPLREIDAPPGLGSHELIESHFDDLTDVSVCGNGGPIFETIEDEELAFQRNEEVLERAQQLRI